jgi:hypothetical protein
MIANNLILISDKIEVDNEISRLLSNKKVRDWSDHCFVESLSYSYMHTQIA